MEFLKKISLSQAIWYSLPGAMFVFILLFQLSIIWPTQILELIEELGIVVLLIISVIIGFFLDGLRLYRLRPKYQAIKRSYYQELQKIVGSTLDAKYIQEYIYKTLTDTEYNTIRFYHSMWIMYGQVSASILILSIVIWIVVLIGGIKQYIPCCLLNFTMSTESFIICCCIFLFTGIVVSFRIMQVSIQGQKNCNNMYCAFARSNNRQIREALKNGYIT